MLLYVQQESWQESQLIKYGNTVTLMDTMYVCTNLPNTALLYDLFIVHV